MKSKIFSLPYAWFESRKISRKDAMTYCKQSVLQSSKLLMVNPRLARNPWCEIQENGIERVCVEIIYDRMRVGDVA